MACQGKKAQDKDNFELWPTDARPLNSDYHFCTLRTCWSWCDDTRRFTLRTCWTLCDAPRGRIQLSGKWRPKPVQALTPSGIELQRPRLVQWMNNTAWSNLGAFMVVRILIIFPTLPPSETCFTDFLIFFFKIQCFENTCPCWNRLDWRRCGVESSVIQPKYALLCALRPKESCIETALEIG